MDGESLSDFFGESDNFSGATASPDDIFSILDAFESASGYNNQVAASKEDGEEEFEFQRSGYCYSPLSANFQESESEIEPKRKKQKLNTETASGSRGQREEGQQRISHITVERQRRKQMNQHLTVLRSLMPCFYVKRGDQASIIGGVVHYINELQQVLQSLEAKKQRKTYTEVLSPRIVSSPRLSPLVSPLSPRKPALSPRKPQPSSPYVALLHQQPPPSPCNSSTSSINDSVNELVATSKSAAAEVEVKFSGPNLLLKTASHRVPGQAAKIISALEELALEILQVNINMVDETVLNSFTIKIGIECQVGAEEVAQLIQQTFC